MKATAREMVILGIIVISILVGGQYAKGHMQTFEVDGESMLPTLHDGDRILSNTKNITVENLYIGDIVIIEIEPKFYVVKRIIAKGNQTVEIREGQLYVDDKIVREPFINEWETGFRPADLGRVRVPEGYIFVLGDNRLHSSDSREFGYINPSIVKGKVTYIMWPFKRMTKLEEEE